MNTFQLECFLAVANSLSFARAAKQMGVSQPTITHQIQSLEDELNTKLFYRSTRLVEITPEGKAFVSDAKSMLAISEQAKMRIQSKSQRKIETLSIGCGNHVQLAMLSEVLKQLKTEVSNLHPHLLVSPYEQLFQHLGTEQLDLIFGVYDNAAIKGNVKYKELLQSDIVCICRSEHTFSKKEALQLSDLKDETLIFCDPMSLTPEMAKLQYRLAENRDPADILFCSSSAEAYVLSRSGFGIALLPEILIPDDNKITKVKFEDAPKLAFGLYYKPSTGDDLIRKFVSLSKSFFDSISQKRMSVILQEESN